MMETRGAVHSGAPEQASAVRFRGFEVSDTDRAIELLSIGRPDDYKAQKAHIFHWQFFRNPHSDGRPPFLVGELDGTVVALNGFMPVRARFHGHPIEACWSCDTYVSGEHRGKGIGKQLIAQVTKAAPLVLGYGISDMSDPIFEKFDWRLHGGIELVFFHLAERGMRGRIKNAVSRVASLRGIRSRAAEYEVWDELSPNAIDELEELWNRHRDEYSSTVERDGAYMRWKYFEHPIYRYRAYVERADGRVAAVLIVRHDPTETVIVDYSGPAEDESTVAGLAAEVVRAEEVLGTTRIKCESTHRPLISGLKRVGFVKSGYSSRFRVRANSGEGDPLQGWLLTPGDSDGDLLVCSPAQPDVSRVEQEAV